MQILKNDEKCQINVPKYDIQIQVKNMTQLISFFYGKTLVCRYIYNPYVSVMKKQPIKTYRAVKENIPLIKASLLIKMRSKHTNKRRQIAIKVNLILFTFDSSVKSLYSQRSATKYILLIFVPKIQQFNNSKLYIRDFPITFFIKSILLINSSNVLDSKFINKFKHKQNLRFKNYLKLNMSIHEYNGGTLVGMVGKDCVGIACDRRFGKQMLTITNDFQRVFKYQDNLIMGLGGLGTDIQTFSALMEQKINLYRLKENKDIKPVTFCNLVAYSLFEKRFGSWIVQPIVAGVQNGEPVLCSYDSIGAQCMIQRFQCAGTGSQQLMAICEAYYKPDMQKQELSFKLHQILTSACDRDMLSGWGAIVYIVTKDGVTTQFIKTKQS